MNTSIEIAKILIREKGKNLTHFGGLNKVYSSIGKKKLKGFDAGLMELGGTITVKNKR